MKTRTLISIALVLGAVVGVGGVYVTGGFEGNGAVSTEAVAMSAQTHVEIDRLRPYFTGDIAAMLVRDDVKLLGDVSFQDIAGGTLTLSDIKAEYKLVNLWATWCAPCREEMPWLDALQATHGDERFAVIAISVDGGSADKPKAFYDDIGLENLSFFHDPTIGVFNRLKREGLAFGLPVTLLLDGNNRVIANMNGPAHWDGPDAHALVQALKQQ